MVEVPAAEVIKKKKADREKELTEQEIDLEEKMILDSASVGPAFSVETHSMIMGKPKAKRMEPPVTMATMAIRNAGKQGVRT